MTGLAPYMFPVGGFDPVMAAAAFPLEQLRADAEQALDAFEARVRTTAVGSYERRRMDEEAGMGLPEYVLLHSSRPVLVVPARGTVGPVGDNVTVAWNGSANAVRAITSAIALLRRARQVQLVVFNPGPGGALHGDLPGADMGLYMARHGVRVEVCALDCDSDTREALLEHVRRAGSDLIVMGAYGHSRFRENLLGGVTRSALLASPLPLWMAH